MTAGAIGFGRFHGESIDLQRCLGVCAVLALIAIPVIGTLAALGFLAAGMALLGLQPIRASEELIAFKGLLVLPAFCIISMLWSDVPGASMRFGIQLAVTFVLAIVLAHRLPLRLYLTTLLGMLFAITFASVLVGNYRSDTGALTGFYASKNAMGMAAAIMAILAFGTIRWHRLLQLRNAMAGGAVLVGLAAVMLAQSISALIMVAVGFSAFGMVYLLRHVRILPALVASIFLTLLTVLISIVIAANFDLFAALFVEVTGKDLTLTGRTDLWSIATDLIAERPLLGLGFQAFWVPSNELAQAIWYRFGIESQSGFSFHNTYLSNAVEIGVIGVGIQTLMIVGALVISGRMAIATGDRGALTLFAITAMIISMTPIDVPVFFQLNLFSVILISAIIYPTNARRS